MIGDSLTDIRTARAAGIPVIAVDFGYTERPVSELGPTALSAVLRNCRRPWPSFASQIDRCAAAIWLTALTLKARRPVAPSGGAPYPSRLGGRLRVA